MGRGQGTFGKCQPCGACNLSNGTGTLICGIICAAYAGIWVFINIIYLCYTFWLTSFGVSGLVSLYLFTFIVGFLLSVGYLVLCILLIFATRKNKRQWVFWWILGTILLMGACFFFSIVAQIWWAVGLAVDATTVTTGRRGIGSLRGYASAWGYLNIFLCPGFLPIVLWIWYPWWIAYSYYVQLGGKPWSTCCAYDGSGGRINSARETPSERSQNYNA